MGVQVAVGSTVQRNRTRIRISHQTQNSPFVPRCHVSPERSESSSVYKENLDDSKMTTMPSHQSHQSLLSHCSHCPPPGRNWINSTWTRRHCNDNSKNSRNMRAEEHHKPIIPAPSDQTIHLRFSSSWPKARQCNLAEIMEPGPPCASLKNLIMMTILL